MANPTGSKTKYADSPGPGRNLRRGLPRRNYPRVGRRRELRKKRARGVEQFTPQRNGRPGRPTSVGRPEQNSAYVRPRHNTDRQGSLTGVLPVFCQLKDLMLGGGPEGPAFRGRNTSRRSQPGPLDRRSTGLLSQPVTSRLPGFEFPADNPRLADCNSFNADAPS